MRPSVAALSLFPALILTGCALSPTAPSSGPLPVSSSAITIHGVLHGGQQPVSGAQIYLFTPNTSGYGGNGIAASSLNASLSLLNSGVLTNISEPSNPGGQDGSSDYYVKTDATGGFTISGDYSCTSAAPQGGGSAVTLTGSEPVYLYAVGGNPGAGTNTAAGFLASLGPCNGLSSSTSVQMNEVTTVAMAYATAGFATDATHISSSGTALALTGINNAFANTTNLVNLSTGNALLTTPGGNGTAPQAEMYTLANILAICINSTGPTSPQCNGLLGAATSTGAVGGTVAPDTATAAIYIAHYPGSNIYTLYTLPNGTNAYGGGLTALPNDFSLAITFDDGGTQPCCVVIDGGGNAWIWNQSNPNTLSKLTPLGTSAPGSPFSGNGLYTSGDGGAPNYGITVDPNGNVWIDSVSNVLSEFTNSGAAASGSPFTYASSAATPIGPLAADAYGNIWDATPAGLQEFSSSGAVLSPASHNVGGYAVVGYGGGYGYFDPINGIAIGAGSSSVLMNCTEKATSGGQFTLGLCDFSTSTDTFGTQWSFSDNDPATIAFDSFGSAWVGEYNLGNATRYTVGNPGVSVYGSDVGCGLGSGSVAIDGAGTIWLDGGQGLCALASPGTTTSQPVMLSPGNGYRGSSSGIAYPTQVYNAIAADGSGNLWYGGCPSFFFGSASPVTEIIGIAAPVITPLSAATASGSTGPGTRP